MISFEVYARLQNLVSMVILLSILSVTCDPDRDPWSKYIYNAGQNRHTNTALFQFINNLALGNILHLDNWKMLQIAF